MNTLKKTLLLVCGILILTGALLCILYHFGLLTVRSGVRVGFIESKNASCWTARYSYLNGTCEGRLHTEETTALLHTDITTNKGTLPMEIKDSDGNFVFTQDDIQTSSFDLKVPTTVTVHFTASGHSGSFDVRW